MTVLGCDRLGKIVVSDVRRVPDNDISQQIFVFRPQVDSRQKKVALAHPQLRQLGCDVLRRSGLGEHATTQRS